MESLAVLADDITAQTDTQVEDGTQVEGIMGELSDLSGYIHESALEQRAGITSALKFIETIAEKAQQIVEKTSHQHQRGQFVFEEIQHLESISKRNVQKLHETQHETQELVTSVEKLRSLVGKFTV